MKLVIQRVKEAAVTVSGKTVGRIQKGMLILLGVAQDDTSADADRMAGKVLDLRMFEDDAGKMNLSIEDVKGECLVVSQFTLLGDCRKGRRPSFDKAADPEKGKELYEYFVEQLRGRGAKVATGEFRAMMDVSLVNDGPVTLILDSERHRTQDTRHKNSDCSSTSGDM